MIQNSNSKNSKIPKQICVLHLLLGLVFMELDPSLRSAGKVASWINLRGWSVLQSLLSPKCLLKSEHPRKYHANTTKYLRTCLLQNTSGPQTFVFFLFESVKVYNPSPVPRPVPALRTWWLGACQRSCPSGPRHGDDGTPCSEGLGEAGASDGLAEKPLGLRSGLAESDNPWKILALLNI